MIDPILGSRNLAVIGRHAWMNAGYAVFDDEAELRFDDHPRLPE
jgi:hypothetical protein